MNKNAPIILGIIVALFGAFMIVGNMPVTVEDFEGNLTVDGDLNVTGTGEFGDDVDMNENYILNTDYSHWIHFSMEGGKTNVTINMVPSGVLVQDRHYHRITFAVDTAPGAGKKCNVSLSDGTDTMYVDLVNAEISDYTVADDFNLDVSTETLTLSYSQSAGGAALRGFITIKYHYKENE